MLTFVYYQDGSGMMQNKHRTLTCSLILTLSAMLPINLTGQDSLDVHNQEVEEKDLGDVLRDLLNRPDHDHSQNSGSLLLLPIIGSNPATGFMLDVGGQYAYKAPERICTQSGWGVFSLRPSLSF